MRPRRVPDLDGNYQCPECQLWKQPHEFYKASHTAVGLSTYCKVCTRGKQADYQRTRKQHAGKTMSEIKAEQREAEARAALEEQYIQWIKNPPAPLGPPD